MSQIDITILYPLYNKEKYIDKSLTTILQQKTQYSYKLLVLDDCSTDNSIALIKEKYVQLFDHIEIIEAKQNQGLFHNILKGYYKLDTEFYTVMDPDNYCCSTDFLEKSISFLKTHKDFSLFFGNLYLRKNNKQTLMINSERQILDFREFKGQSWLPAYTNATMFRTNCFTDQILHKLSNINFKYKSAYRGDSFRQRLASKFGKMYYCDEVFGVYNYDMNGIWSSLTEKEQLRQNLRFDYESYLFFKDLKLDTSYDLYYLMNSISSGFQRTIRTPIVIDTMKNRKNDVNIQKFKKTGMYYNFTFFLPSLMCEDTGHAFIIWANYLNDVLGLSCTMITLPNSPIEGMLSNDIKVIYMDNSVNTIRLPKYSKVIVPIILAYELPRFENDSGVEIYFWIDHPCSMELLASRSSVSSNKIINLISTLGQDNCLVYMDQTCYDTTQMYTGLNLNKRYLPAPIEIKSQSLSKLTIKHENEINICWLGKVDRDKIYSILNVLENLNEYATNKQINFYIIDGGNSMSMINNANYVSKLHIFTIDSLRDIESRNQYITENIDIVVALGQSALLAASLGKPTILPVYNIHDSFHTDSFLWLFNTTQYTLENVTDSDDTSKYQPLEEMLNDIYLNDQLGDYSSRTLEYVKNNHCIEKNITYLLKYIISHYKSRKNNSPYDNFYTVSQCK